MRKLLELFFLVLVVIEFTDACNGFKMKINSMKPCTENGIIKTNHFDASLDKDCNVVFSGCLDVSKEIKIWKGTYEVSKPPLPAISGEFDTCELITSNKHAQLNQVLTAFGLPKKCPLPAKKYCINGKKKINISAFKYQLGMAEGKLNVRVKSEHDIGQSCIDTNLTISRK